MQACSPDRRCRSRECAHCGPIRAGDEYRKFLENINAYGGRVLLVAVSPPGAQVLEWDEVVCASLPPHRHTADLGCRVKARDGWAFNRTATARYARLWKAATVSADRWVRRHGWKGAMPRRIASVWAPQGRGVWHVHECLPAEAPVELLWSRQVVRFIDAARRREEAMGAEERRVLLAMESSLEVAPRSFYGWGFVDRNPLRRGGASSVAGAASYLARNAAGYLGENASEATRLVGRSLRSYVSRRLTTATGCTLTRLRRSRYLYVCLVDSGSLGLWPKWDEEEVERCWSLLERGQTLARAP